MTIGVFSLSETAIAADNAGIVKPADAAASAAITGTAAGIRQRLAAAAVTGAASLSAVIKITAAMAAAVSVAITATNTMTRIRPFASAVSTCDARRGRDEVPRLVCGGGLCDVRSGVCGVFSGAAAISASVVATFRAKVLRGLTTLRLATRRGRMYHLREVWTDVDAGSGCGKQ